MAPNTAGILTYDMAVPFSGKAGLRAVCLAALQLSHVKYSNGGCSGFEPDFLFIYSANNFSNRIFIRYSVFPELFRISSYYITLCAVYQAPQGVFLRNKADNLPLALHMRRRGDKIKDDALRFNICLNGGHRPVVIYKRRDVYAFT